MADKSPSLFQKIKEGISDWVLVSPGFKAAIYWLVILTGSFLHDFLPFPQSYLSNKRNVFNVYFVKLGWGWTLGLHDSIHVLNLACIHLLQTVCDVKAPQQVGRGDVWLVFLGELLCIH
ncbi:fat storage-inducing transmembrane protein 2 [Porites harrisoni]